MPTRTLRSRGSGWRRLPLREDVGGYGGSGSRFLGRIPGSRNACKRTANTKSVTAGVQTLHAQASTATPSRVHHRSPSICKKNKALTVANMLEMVSKHMYAPTAATAGLSFCHHHTHVVPKYTPVIVSITVSDPTNAHGESPPVRILPPRKNRFREGCSSYLRTGFPVSLFTMGVALSGGSICGGGLAMNEAWLIDVPDPCSGDKLCFRWPGEVGERSRVGPLTPSSKVMGETSADRVWMGLNAPLGPGLTGEFGERSKLNGRLNSFSKLPRIRAPALTFESLRPYGPVWVTIVGRGAATGRGRPPIGSNGSRLNLLEDSDGVIVGALASSIEWSGLSDPSEILSRFCEDPSWERRTASTVESPTVDIEPAVEGRGRGGVAERGMLFGRDGWKKEADGKMPPTCVVPAVGRGWIIGIEAEGTTASSLFVHFPMQSALPREP